MRSANEQTSVIVKDLLDQPPAKYLVRVYIPSGAATMPFFVATFYAQDVAQVSWGEDMEPMLRLTGQDGETIALFPTRYAWMVFANEVTEVVSGAEYLEVERTNVADSELAAKDFQRIKERMRGN